MSELRKPMSSLDISDAAKVMFISLFMNAKNEMTYSLISSAPSKAAWDIFKELKAADLLTLSRDGNGEVRLSMGLAGNDYDRYPPGDDFDAKMAFIEEHATQFSVKIDSDEARGVLTDIEAHFDVDISPTGPS